MKAGKILIVMILAALGFQAHAQRGAFVHESYNSVRKYIHPLRLSHNQVVDWTRLNRQINEGVNRIERDRSLNRRMKTKKINRLFERQNRSLRNILSRRQYQKFVSMRSHNGWHRSRYSSGRRGNQGDRSGYRDNNPSDDEYYDRPVRNTRTSCPATGSGNYYDGTGYNGRG